MHACHEGIAIQHIMSMIFISLVLVLRVNEQQSPAGQAANEPKSREAGLAAIPSMSRCKVHQHRNGRSAVVPRFSDLVCRSNLNYSTMGTQDIRGLSFIKQINNISENLGIITYYTPSLGGGGTGKKGIPHKIICLKWRDFRSLFYFEI